MSYLFDNKQNILTQLKPFNFKYEDTLQRLLGQHPEILLSIPELEINEYEHVIVCREYPTNRGCIDILLVTDNGEIIIIETKLLKNPESTRTVVAQVIDYIKALSVEEIDETIVKIKKTCATCDINEKLMSYIYKNISTGNFKVLIVGDFINPNILGMVDSIHSAPHLAFSIYLVELNVYAHDDSVVITPKLVSKTYEVERSVIRLELNWVDKKHKIESETPSKESKGNKPILSWEQYVEFFKDNEFRIELIKFRNEWIEKVDNSINMGAVGFSAGVLVGGRRIPIQLVYDQYLSLLSEKLRNNYSIPDDLYGEYIQNLKKISNIYDEFIVSNKVYIPFEKITADDLRLILDSAMTLALKLKGTVK